MSTNIKKIYNKPNIFYEKANALRLDNLYKEAAANYLNAILIDRKSAECYFGLGICYKNLKEYQKAIKYFEQATELKENYYEAYFELGICHQLEGIGCGAIKNFIKAIQINPESTEAILQLGLSHEICEEYDLALMIYQKLIDNNIGFLKAYDCKSTLLMKLDRYQEASEVLHRLIKQNSDYYNAYASLGICFDKLGKYTFAQRYYRKFLNMKPFSQKTNFIRNRMEKIKTSKPIPKNFRLCK